MFTYENVKRQLEECGLCDMTFILENGAVVSIRPCLRDYDVRNMIEDCEYFLAEYHSDQADLNISAETLEKVYDNVMNIDRQIEQDLQDKKDLRAYFDKHQAEGWDEDSWGFYSDWHKDCYGYRPHGKVCGVYVSPYSI